MRVLIFINVKLQKSFSRKKEISENLSLERKIFADFFLWREKINEMNRSPGFVELHRRCAWVKVTRVGEWCRRAMRSQ